MLGVVVEEWRDGVLLGNHIRDFQFNVQLCEPALVSTLGVDGEIVTDVYLDCEDFTIPFSNFSTGADSYLWLLAMVQPQKIMSRCTCMEIPEVHCFTDL